MKNYRILLLLSILCYGALAQETKKVSLQLLWKHQFEFAGFYMAKEKGFYDEVGLDVKLKEYSFDVDIVSDVEKGKSDFGVGYTSILLNKSAGSKIVLLNALFQSSPHILVSLESSNIKSIGDFKNKTIMIDKDAIKSATLLSMLYSKNIRMKDITIEKLNFNINNLIDGTVDIYSVYSSNELYKLDNKNLKYKIWDPKDYGFDFYNDILFTSNKLIAKDPKLVEKFQNASLLGWEYAFNNINETIEVILKKYNTQNKTKEALKYEARILKDLAYKNNVKLGNINKEKIQRIYDVYNLMGLTKNKIDLDDFIYDLKLINKRKMILNKEEKNYIKNKKVIKMCNNPNWTPIEFIKENDTNQIDGIAIDTLKLIENRLGIKFQNVPTISWSQSQQFLKEKKCDILPAAIKTKNRQEYANFTKPYLDYKLAIITKNDKPFIGNIENIIDKSIARKKDSGLVFKLRSLYPDINIVETNDYLESLQKVSSGEVYCTIATLPVASYYINLFKLDNLYIAGYTDMRYKLSIAVRKDDLTLLSILEKSLSSISKTEHRKINGKWSDIKIQESFDYSLLWKLLLGFIIVSIFFIYRQFILHKSNQNLKQAVKEKTKELQELNKNLELKIKQAVEENSQKDKILFSQSKMAAMGEMIGNISHQWRQPLSIISTVASGMKLKIEYDMFDAKEEEKNLDTLLEATSYLSNTIDDFKNFLNPSKSNKVFNINSIIEKNINMFGKGFTTHDINFIRDKKDIAIEIKGNENELLQVIINILNNSKDALISSDVSEKLIFIDLEKSVTDVTVSIKDTAGGIAEEILPKIFDAYFTTKHQSKGTGLGLYMSYQIIANSFNGELSVKNETFTYNDIKYKGAKFTIKIPSSIIQ
ncbi:MAG: ABC transporter substrate-binding protein [Campylobacterota bacterium]|nr:ABC transporter substrate-binding protein [Campylobacterota bacterium]